MARDADRCSGAPVRTSGPSGSPFCVRMRTAVVSGRRPDQREPCRTLVLRSKRLEDDDLEDGTMHGARRLGSAVAAAALAVGIVMSPMASTPSHAAANSAA